MERLLAELCGLADQAPGRTGDRARAQALSSSPAARVRCRRALAVVLGHPRRPGRIELTLATALLFSWLSRDRTFGGDARRSASLRIDAAGELSVSLVDLVTVRARRTTVAIDELGAALARIDVHVQPRAPMA